MWNHIGITSAFKEREQLSAPTPGVKRMHMPGDPRPEACRGVIQQFGVPNVIKSADLSSASVLVVIPAHNEAASIGATLLSLRQQTRPPDEMLVVCDNCTDNTAEIAASCGARVFVTAGNTGRKAGALNQALRQVLPA